MGTAEAVPFGNRDAADAFAAANGGKVVTFAQIPSAYVLGSDAAGDQTENDRSRRANELTGSPMLKRKSHAPANDSNRCDRGRFGASRRSVAPRGRAFPSAGTDRRSGPRYRSRYFIRTGRKPNRLVQLCLQDVRRLEQQFSLYRTEFGDLHAQPYRRSCFSRCRHGVAAQGRAVLFRPD